MEFASSKEISKIPELLQEFLQNVICDYEGLFVSDEATVWDVSMAAPEELLKRCFDYYGRAVSLEDLKQPLWKLLPQLSAGRQRET